MGDKTGIAWTDATWNAVVGCTHVSDGCDHCYAASLASGRLAHTPTYQGLAEGGHFNGTVRLLPDRLDQPIRWQRPRMIFVNSMSDVFHKDVPDEYIAQMFAVMALTPRHTYQILSKRHGRMRSLLRSERFVDLVKAALKTMWEANPKLQIQHARALPLPNVWLGVSVENQHWADSRIPALLETPAAVRFLSCEPLLGAIKLSRLHAHCPTHDFRGGFCTGPCPDLIVPDWVIVGGESGRDARPMHPDWARTLRDQCNAYGIAFFMKQAGEVLAREWGCAERKGHDPAEWPEPFPREYPQAVTA